MKIAKRSITTRIVAAAIAAIMAAGVSAIVAGCFVHSQTNAKPNPAITPVPAAPAGTSNGMPPPGTANANTPYGRGL